MGTILLATGWGDTKADPLVQKLPEHLQEVKVPLVSTFNCNDANSWDGLITRNMICAGTDQGGENACQGDSGGPLTKKDSAGKYTVLTGITSWGSRYCALPNSFIVYTRVSRFRDWIISQIN